MSTHCHNTLVPDAERSLLGNKLAKKVKAGVQSLLTTHASGLCLIYQYSPSYCANLTQGEARVSCTSGGDTARVQCRYYCALPPLIYPMYAKCLAG